MCLADHTFCSYINPYLVLGNSINTEEIQQLTGALTEETNDFMNFDFNTLFENSLSHTLSTCHPYLRHEWRQEFTIGG